MRYDIVIDGYLTDGRNTQFNDNFETFSNQESNNDSSDIEVGELNTNDCGDDCEYLKTGNNNQYLPNSGPNEQLSHNPYHSNVAGQNDNDDHNRSNNDSFHNRSEQSSIESFEYGNEAAGEPQVLPDDTFRFVFCIRRLFYPPQKIIHPDVVLKSEIWSGTVADYFPIITIFKIQSKSNRLHRDCIQSCKQYINNHNKN